MGRFVKGDIVASTFPFSDGSGNKKRPSVVLATWQVNTGGLSFNDCLICMISTKDDLDDYTIELLPGDTTDGKFRFRTSSVIRPTYLYAVQEDLIINRIDSLSSEKLSEVLRVITGLINN